jgi:hypothetical protein
MATAFRWMPWRDDPDRAAPLWQAWLDGYRSRRAPRDSDLRALPALAALQCAYWLCDEVGEALAEGAPKDELLWYVDDHCRTAAALMAQRR